MSSKNFKSNDVLKDENMVNTELQRAESMSKVHIDITKQKNNEVIDQEKTSVILYAGSKTRFILSKIRNMEIEIVMFFYMFSFVMRNITSATMIIEKVCEVHLGNSSDVCNDLSPYPELKVTVEKIANNYNLGHTLLQLAPSAFLSLFIGSWSDEYSRKIPLIVSLVGIILDDFGTIACAYFMDSRVEYYFIPAIFTGISGGYISVYLVLYSYVSDITTSTNRTMKYALVDIALIISMPLGNLAGGWLFKFYGYVPVFLTSTCGHILALCLIIFMLEETRGLDKKDSWRVKLRCFWSFNSVIRSYKVTVKRRPNRGREQIWLLLLAMDIGIFNFAATNGMAFFFVHHLYNWGNTTYSTVTAAYAILGSILIFIVVSMSKKFNFGDPTLGIIGSMSLLLKSIGTGLAFEKWIFFLAYALGLLGSLGALAGRSRISKVTSKDDLGKVFALLTSAEMIVSVIAMGFASQAFNATLTFFPGLIFVVMGCMVIINLAIYIWLACLPKVNDGEIDENLPKEKEDHAVGKTTNEEGEKSFEKC